MWEVFVLRNDHDDISTTIGAADRRTECYAWGLSATAERAVLPEKLPGVRRALCDCSVRYATFASTVICIVPR
jgi:hypothetical protein